MTRIPGIDDRIIQERLAVLDAEIEEKSKKTMDELHRYVLNTMPAKLIDLNTYIRENTRRLRRAEMEELFQERRDMERLIGMAKAYFKRQEEGN